MVQQVELLHKELVINQKYTPCSKENKAVKLNRNQTLTDKKKKQKTVYKTSLNFLKGQNLVKADHGLLMAKGRRRCEISIRQTVKKYKKNKLQPKLTKTVYYRLHIVIPENIGALTGYTKKKTEVYQCAGVDCPMEQLSENTKITITGKVVVDGKTVLQYHTNTAIFPNMSPTDLLEDIDACNIAQKLKDDTKIKFYDAFTQYYLKGVKQAKEDYLTQYSDEEWSQVVSSTLKNGGVQDFIDSGAKNVLKDNGKEFDKSNYNNKMTNTFLENVAGDFKDFINDFYGGYRK